MAATSFAPHLSAGRRIPLAEIDAAVAARLGATRGLGNSQPACFNRQVAMYETVDLHVRPIHHRLPSRVRSHILLCVLAHYVEWHMRQLLAPLLFDDDDKQQAQAARASIVAPATRSSSAKRKAHSRLTGDRLKIHSFQTLLSDLATIAKNRIQPADNTSAAFDMLTRPIGQAVHAAPFKSQYLKQFGQAALTRSLCLSCRIAPDTDLRLCGQNLGKMFSGGANSFSASRLFV